MAKLKKYQNHVLLGILILGIVLEVLGKAESASNAYLFIIASVMIHLHYRDTECNNGN